MVTGSSPGLGIAFAEALVQAGAKVALGARRLDRPSALRDGIIEQPGEAIAVETDVRSREDCQALAEATLRAFGRINVLVNCAGVGTAIPSARESPEEFREVIETNLMGSYWMAQSCVPFMPRGASIINISSVLANASMGVPQAAYSSSKAAIIGLTRHLAQQWSGRKGIRVNALAPGYFPSELTDKTDDEFIENRVKPRIPLGRLGLVEECAAALVFLASDAESYITGACIPVDGGLLTL